MGYFREMLLPVPLKLSCRKSLLSDFVKPLRKSTSVFLTGLDQEHMTYRTNTNATNDSTTIKATSLSVDLNNSKGKRCYNCLLFGIISTNADDRTAD